MHALLQSPTRILFFTGKGGVGKTTVACSVSIGLADAGRRVLLVSTDPASNLDEVLGLRLGATPTAVTRVAGLSALNINPEQAAEAYRERVVGPYRALLPAAAVASIEEQLSGACTVEIAAFDEFSKLLGDPGLTRDFDHIVFDTAPTGHTLRLLELPAAWTGFIETNVGGTSCLGPLAGLKEQRRLYAASASALRSPSHTTLILVARPDTPSLDEAERTRRELGQLDVHNVRLVLNGLFRATDATDGVATALEARGRRALDAMPAPLAALPRSELLLQPFALLGAAALRRLSADRAATAQPPATQPPATQPPATQPPATELPAAQRAALAITDFDALVRALYACPRGVVMTMGKGGVGKTSVAAAIAVAVARQGRAVTLTTTDPAAHVQQTATAELPALRVTRIDPAAETRRYTAEVLATAGAELDAAGRALLEEDLRSPCTEEIAVFRAFAETVAEGADRLVVVDTAPTGHTLLLLDSAEAYHREVLKRSSSAPDAVRRLLPRLRDPAFTRVLLVTLPEATPIHEAMQLERDLERAKIRPHAWVVNQSLTPLPITDPVLRARRAREGPLLTTLAAHAHALVLLGWREHPLAGSSTPPPSSPVRAGARPLSAAAAPRPVLCNATSTGTVSRGAGPS